MALLYDKNERVDFIPSLQYAPRGIVYIGIADNGPYVFTFEGSFGSSKFKIISPADSDISLKPGRLYTARRSYTVPGYEGYSYNINLSSIERF